MTQRIRPSKHSGLYKRQYKHWYAIFRTECQRITGPFVQKHSLMDFIRHEDGSISIVPHFGVL